MKILKPIEQQKLRGRHNSNIKVGVGIITALSSGMPTSLFSYMAYSRELIDAQCQSGHFLPVYRLKIVSDLLLLYGGRSAPRKRTKHLVTPEN